MSELQNAIDRQEKLVLYITGGGSRAISLLLENGGASKYLLEAYVPYSNEALERLIGPTSKSVSASTAELMAFAAYRKAKLASREEKNSVPVGIGCTASLSKDNQREGRFNGAYVYLVKPLGVQEWKVEFHSDAPRIEQENELAQIIVDIAFGKLKPENTLTRKLTVRSSSSLYMPIREREDVLFLADVAIETPIKLVLPGSFNPIHDGHIGMMRIAQEMTGLQGVYEISAANRDKDPITITDMADRVHAIARAGGKAILTNAKLFKDKYKLLRNNGHIEVTFAIGSDTFSRLANDTAKEGFNFRCEFQRALIAGSVKFIVFGRRFVGAHGSVHSTGKEFIPAGDLGRVFLEASTFVPEEIFSSNISSTEIRNATKN